MLTTVSRPRIGISTDLADGRFTVDVRYADLVAGCGGLPLLLPAQPDRVADVIELCDGFVLTGGDDPIMEHWGEPTHPRAKPLHPRRQAYEIALLAALAELPQRPVLGICLGMQLMALHAGGRLDQHLPETLATHDRHWGRVAHPVTGALGDGAVVSHHRQAVVDPGLLSVIATADDGVIEAVRDEQRPFYLGVQWHCERTEDETLGPGLIRDLVAATGQSRA
jgi:putative glutamine amidotransferase